MKKQRRFVTLAIGDGANDVAMIQEAHIGIGISGKEGSQAVNASDFSLGQFRFLGRLLLIHGKQDYYRTAKVVLFSFYKNTVLTFVLFLFTFFSGYSGQSLFEDNIYTTYNIVLFLPVVCMGVFDRPVSSKTATLSVAVVGIQMVQALVDALLLFFVPYYLYSSW